MKVSDYIVSFFEEQNVNVIFGYIGGMITHLVDSIGKNDTVNYIQTYHEQTAAIAAEGYAIESGKFGVAISTSGPGVTNMMTGIADAYFDSIPVIFISGQVNSYEYKYNKPIRQQGFQEMDVVNVVKPITKYAKLIDDPLEIKYELQKAVYIATHGRKGPVMLDIPMNIQRSEICTDEIKGYKEPLFKIKEKDLSGISELISSSKRPMLLIGGGCSSDEAKHFIELLLSKTSIPVVTSLMGRGLIDETYDNYVGMIGSYGNRCANMGIANADLLIALGARLDTRQTGAKVETFLCRGKIIHVDIDDNELKYHRLKNRISINMDVGLFLNKLCEVDCHIEADISNWNRYLHELKLKYNQDEEIKRFVENKSPYLFMQKLNEITKEGDIICADIGQNQMWAAQTIKLKRKQKFVTSGGLAPMGFSLPCAVGMSFASPQKTIYSICGDGGFHMSVQSLMLISQYDLNIKVVVMNNSALGMITQFQHLYFNDKMNGTTEEGGYWNPDIKFIAKTYNLQYLDMDEDKLEDYKCIKKIIDNNVLVNYHIEGLTTVSPKLEYNKPIYMPLPLLEFNELRENMLIDIQEENLINYEKD